ncbi:MAG: 2-phospho-L-lactate transferase [Acidimicrobiia bacterium]
MSRATLLAGGVGGARLARGLAAILSDDDLTIVVNVGDDERIYGVHVAADLDTVTYTLAGIEGPHGWGVVDDTFNVLAGLDTLGVDTSFRLGDRDLALCLRRTQLLDDGVPLSTVTDGIRSTLGVGPTILPATDDELRTRINTVEAGWLAFQDYFVRRGHRDEVIGLEYAGSSDALPAPGVIEAITTADTVFVAPSNPPLSIHPILAISEIRQAVADAPNVIAVSPLFGGKALKGPADRVMASIGLPAGNAGVLAAYSGLISDLVVDTADAGDADTLAGDVRIHSTDTRFAEAEPATRFARWLLDLR